MKPCIAVLLLVLAGLLPASGCAEDAKPSGIGCYISTGDNDWLWTSPPTQMLAGFAWEVLCVPQNGYVYALRSEADAVRSYQQYPPAAVPAR